MAHCFSQFLKKYIIWRWLVSLKPMFIMTLFICSRSIINLVLVTTDPSWIVFPFCDKSCQRNGGKLYSVLHAFYLASTFCQWEIFLCIQKIVSFILLFKLKYRVHFFIFFIWKNVCMNHLYKKKMILFSMRDSSKKGGFTSMC
jgi:hypothetical protein